MDLLIIVLVVLATARLTRLVVDDLITQPLRDRLTYFVATHEKSRLGRFLHDLTSCTWCTSVWVAAGVVGLAYVLPTTVFIWPALALSASYLVGFLGLIEIWLEENSGHDH